MEQYHMLESDVIKFVSSIRLPADMANGCWEWTGWLHSRGYGRFYIKSKAHAAHRIAYELFKDEAPGDLCVCHTCDNRKCVRPSHLWLGTHQENIRDMMEKGRSCKGEKHRSRLYPEGVAKGEAHRSTKFSDAIVRSMFELQNAGWTQRRIAMHLGVSQRHVSDILAGKYRRDALIAVRVTLLSDGK